jgi:PhnB protein
MAVKPVPDGYHTVTPFVPERQGQAELIDFLKNAFGAEEIMRMPGPDRAVMHAEVSIGNSRLIVGRSNADRAAIESPSTIRTRSEILGLSLAHKEDPSTEEMAKRMAAMNR